MAKRISKARVTATRKVARRGKATLTAVQVAARNMGESDDLYRQSPSEASWQRARADMGDYLDKALIASKAGFSNQEIEGAAERGREQARELLSRRARSNPWEGPTKRSRPKLGWQTKPKRKRKKSASKPTRRNPMYPPEKVRTVKFSPYRKGMGPTFTLELWDLNTSDRDGKFALGYTLTEKQPGQKRNRVLFECKEPACAVFTRDAVDSDDAARDVIMWLTLKPGDTDAEWFDNYSPDQMDFAQTDAEALHMEAINRFGEE